MQVNNSTKYELCPLCKSSSICEAGKLNYLGKVQFSSREIQLVHVPELWKCNQCLSRFVQNAVDVNTAKMLYEIGRADERWSAVAFDQGKVQEVVICMEGVFKDKASVLDVGCNTGELLDFAHGFGCDTSGVELSSASRETLHHKGHRVYSSLDESAGEYDVITAFDLFEHLYDAPAFLEACRAKLAQNGKLVILTGSVDSWSAKLSGARWWYAQYPEHIVFPSKRYFSKYSGFQIEEWLPTYASKDYKYPLYRGLLGLLKGLARGGTYSGLPSLGSDHILVVLRK